MKDFWSIAVVLALGVGMLFLPSAPTLVAFRGESAVATVVEVDDEGVQKQGLIEFGSQNLVVELPDGTRRRAANQLRGQLEFDKKFVVGDTCVVVLGPEPLVASDHYRIRWLFALFGAFAVLLLLFGGFTGLKALFSFVFALIAIWKALIPACLSGYDPRLVSFALVTFLTAVIMTLVAGLSRRALSATLGAVLGIGVSLMFAEVFSRALHVSGATMPFVQALLYSGFDNLSISDLFIGSVILASSGAVMDLGMDIASSVEEVHRHNPSLAFRPLFLSGLRVGRAVVGTMTTTLLLAYSGGYLTLLMKFAAEGTNPLDFLNTTLVSAELVKTLVGSFGLVLVAPFTALISALVYGRLARS